MNKKAGVIGFAIYLFMFIIFWIFFLSKLMTLAGTEYIRNNGATGLEAFFYANLNLWVLVGIVLSVLAYGVLGGDQ